MTPPPMIHLVFSTDRGRSLGLGDDNKEIALGLESVGDCLRLRLDFATNGGGEGQVLAQRSIDDVVEAIEGRTTLQPKQDERKRRDTHLPQHS